MNIPPALRRVLPGLIALSGVINTSAQDALTFPLAQSLITVESTPPPLGEATPAPKPSPAAAPAPAPIALKPTTPPPAGSLLLNFQGASLSDVLAYLSEAAGFVIVQEAPVAGTVNIVSKQPISTDEAVDLLNSVLAEKGYVAIRNGRILKIVARSGSQKRDLPVATGSDPAKIPRNDEVVTQILPLRFGEAGKLVENLRPLLSDSATISANEGSNAILLTDTQANIRRMAMIIHALDTSVSSISTIRVFPLAYADSKSLAETVTSLFVTPTNTQNQPQNQFGRFGGGGGRFGGGQPPQPDPAAKSGALEAAARVVAVADEASNSLIVSASEDIVNQVAELVSKVDRSTTDITDTRIFRLINADAVETATIINNLYGDGSTTPSSANGGQNRGNGGNNNGGRAGGNNNNNNNNGRGGNFPGVPPQFAALLSGNQRSDRALQQARVVAVGDPRTNSLLVSASRDSITSIAEMIGRLDATDARKQHVYVYQLQHADPDSVANVLRAMTGDTTATANAATATSRLTDRAANGASTEATQAATSNGIGTSR